MTNQTWIALIPKAIPNQMIVNTKRTTTSTVNVVTQSVFLLMEVFGQIQIVIVLNVTKMESAGVPIVGDLTENIKRNVMKMSLMKKKLRVLPRNAVQMYAVVLPHLLTIRVHFARMSASKDGVAVHTFAQKKTEEIITKSNTVF